MSNLLKGFNTKQTEQRIIDYNEVISGKIESFKRKMTREKVEADGFVNGLVADVVEELIGAREQAGNDETVASDEELLGKLVLDEKAGEPLITTDELNELAGDIVADANARAAAILEEARREAEVIKNTAYSQAMEEGSRDGYNKGLAKAEAEYRIRVDEVNEEKIHLEQEYVARYKNMEREIVDTLLEVFEKVTHTVSEDNKEIIMHLINRVMNDIDFSGDIFIRVSKEDYLFLVENQGKIYGSSSKDINLSVMEDSSVEKNQCIIETDGGVFDCSLDIQLEQLIKDIKLLSCI